MTLEYHLQEFYRQRIQNFTTNCSASNFENFTCPDTTLNSSLFYDDLAFRRYLFENFKRNRNQVLYSPNLTLIILFSLLNGAICLTSLFGNGLVIWVVALSRRMRTVTNMFIVNLSLADMIIGVFCIPFQFQAALLQRWDLPEIMCSFCPFFQVLSVNLSVFTLTAIALDRHRAVMHPLKFPVPKLTAGVIIGLIWIISIALAIPTYIDRKVVVHGKLFNDRIPLCKSMGLPPNIRLYYYTGLAVVQYFLPLLVISVAYIRMGIRLWGATVPGNHGQGRDMATLKNKRRAVKMLALVVFLFAVCWFPFQSYLFVQQMFREINSFRYINLVFFGIYSLAMSNSCVNPFIYAIYNRKFQEEFSSRLQCLKACCCLGVRNRQLPALDREDVTAQPLTFVRGNSERGRNESFTVETSIRSGSGSSNRARPPPATQIISKSCKTTRSSEQEDNGSKCTLRITSNPVAENDYGFGTNRLEDAADKSSVIIGIRKRTYSGLSGCSTKQGGLFDGTIL